MCRYELLRWRVTPSAYKPTLRAGQWRKVVHIRTDRTEVQMQEDIVRQIDAHLSATARAKKCPPASEDAVRFAEASLGLNIPPLLRLIYLNVGNGGFGPGYGIIGVGGGQASNLGTLVETYDQIKKGADYLGITWSARLLPFCEWGCNIFSCVDCGDTDCQMFQSDECSAPKFVSARKISSAAWWISRGEQWDCAVWSFRVYNPSVRGWRAAYTYSLGLYCG
jgi:hypothetical protein